MHNDQAVNHLQAVDVVWFELDGCLFGVDHVWLKLVQVQFSYVGIQVHQDDFRVDVAHENMVFVSLVFLLLSFWDLNITLRCPFLVLRRLGLP